MDHGQHVREKADRIARILPQRLLQWRVGTCDLQLTYPGLKGLPQSARDPDCTRNLNGPAGAAGTGVYRTRCCTNWTRC